MSKVTYSYAPYYGFLNIKHTINAPPFASLGGYGTHVSTDWQIFTVASDSSAKVYELLNSTSYLTTLQVQKYWWDGCAECYLEFEYDYNGYIRCRYRNNNDETTRWSSWNKISYVVDVAKSAKLARDKCPGCGSYFCYNYEKGYVKRQCVQSIW